MLVWVFIHIWDGGEVYLLLEWDFCFAPWRKNKKNDVGGQTMPKQDMVKQDEILEREIIETMLAGLEEYRPDLKYPESHSDMQGCVRGLLRMFEIKRRPIARPLRLRCVACCGLGAFVDKSSTESYRSSTTCKECGGHGWIEG